MVKIKEPINEELVQLGFLLKYTSYRKFIEGTEIIIYSLEEYHIFRIQHYLIPFKTLEQLKTLLEDITGLIKGNNIKGLGQIERTYLNNQLSSKSN